MPETLVILSVDTEEDNWRAARDGITVENIRELPRLQAFCDRLGIPLTYFTTYQVVATPWAAGVLRDLRATGRAEVAAHVHPWNTPPLDEPFVPRNTMMKNLPASVQSAKLATLTRAMEDAFGLRPATYRTGRFGLGQATTRVLIEQGYHVDCSVTPWVSWGDTDSGADFVGAPLAPYTLDGTTDPRVPVPLGHLLEIPLSCGYSHRPFWVWHRVRAALRARRVRPLRLAGLAQRIGLARPLTLNPEVTSARDMVRLARLIVGEGVPHLSLAFHSSSLIPGLNPLTRTRADVERLYSVIADFAEAIGEVTTPVFATASEAALRLAPMCAFTGVYQGGR